MPPLLILEQDIGPRDSLNFARDKVARFDNLEIEIALPRVIKRV